MNLSTTQAKIDKALRDVVKRSSMIDMILSHTINMFAELGNVYKPYYRADLIILSNEELSNILDKMNRV